MCQEHRGHLAKEATTEAAQPGRHGLKALISCSGSYKAFAGGGGVIGEPQDLGGYKVGEMLSSPRSRGQVESGKTS